MRERTISTLPPAACISRNRSGHGFGENPSGRVSWSGHRHRTVAPAADARSCTLPPAICSTVSITDDRVVDPSASAPCSSTVGARERRLHRPLTRSIEGLSNTIEARSGRGQPTRCCGRASSSPSATAAGRDRRSSPALEFRDQLFGS
jgi:hypothetical protein